MEGVMSGEEHRSVDTETRRKLEQELEKHRAALAKATDDMQVVVLCSHYIRRIGEILRNTRGASD
jgi:hypothetical protein